MIKSGSSILDLLFSKKRPKEKLAISPILSLDSQIDPGAASVDLRLGCTFVVPNRSQLPLLDPHAVDYKSQKARYMEKVYINIGEFFILHPRQFVLGSTLEWIHMPRDLAAYVIGRSTWGRDGLIIATAAGVHPGYIGTLTLELTNLGEVPLKLYPGERYAQLFFQDVAVKKRSTGAKSGFLGSTEPISGTISEKEKEIIQKFPRMATDRADQP